MKKSYEQLVECKICYATSLSNHTSRKEENKFTLCQACSDAIAEMKSTVELGRKTQSLQKK
jgi:hypothetical protein